MRILFLGGVGTIGSEALRDLVASTDFEITIGDADVEKAKQFARSLASDRLDVEYLNADNESKLVDILKGYQAVTNALPFKYDLPVTRAAIEAGVSGVDVSSALQQFELSQKATAEGVTFVPGCGMTPGVTNVLVGKAYADLDGISEVHIAWAAFRCLAPSPGLLTTTFWEFQPDLEDRAYFMDGKYVAVPPFSGAKTINFPGPIGPQEVYFVPHPEIWTLPRSFPELRRVDVRGAWPPETMRLLRVVLDFGFYRPSKVRVGGSESTPLDLLSECLLKLPQAKETALWGYSVHLEVVGVKEERTRRYIFTCSHPHMDRWGGKAAYAKNVGIPLSIATQELVQGRVKLTGVVAPELAFDSTRFIDQLQARGIHVSESVQNA